MVLQQSQIFKVLGGSGDFLDPEAVVDRLDIHPGMRIADFGSGSGYLTILFAQRVGDLGMVTGIDIMEAPLETLRSKASQLNLQNVRTIRGNLEVRGGSGLSDESQDMVVLANILFQNEDKAGIIRETKRVLKPEGILVVIDWKKNGASFGPPNEYRTDPQAMNSIVTEQNFVFQKEIDAGNYHYGFIFKKV